MDYITVDLEWNGNISGRTRQYFNELIEIGAVRCDGDFSVVDTFQILIKPWHHRRLTGRVRDLTGLTSDDVRGGIDFVDAIDIFAEWLPAPSQGGSPCFLSWGTGDILVLLENLGYWDMTDRLSMIGSFCDAQAVCMEALGLDSSRQPSVAAVAEAAGIETDTGELHRALEDSVVTARCLKALATPDLIKKHTHLADADFYGRITFKPRYICDPDNPIIPRGAFRHDCPDCGGRLERKGKFFTRGRAICAEYQCGACGKSYIIKDQFRLTYDGLIHKVTIIEKQDTVAEKEN
ncbi:MAG: exonuclease domain-containing protein [Oscillospiraceae bacterium]|nr:exonuclease domain-containing protein [Oscillospiraceae bacterium]